MGRSIRTLLLTGAATLLALMGAQVGVGLYTEALWFVELGYLPVFWTRLLAEVGTRLVAGTFGALVVLGNLGVVARRLGPIQLRRQYGNIEIAEQVPRRYVLGGIVVVSILAGWWLSGLSFGGDDSLAVLAWLRQVGWGIEDPLFGRDLSFFVFSLPVYFRLIDFFLIAGFWGAALALLGYVLASAVRWRNGRLEVEEEVRLHFVLLGAGIVLLLGLRYWLGRYGLLLEGTGIGGGLGYTDVQARLPAHRLLAGLAVATAAGLLYGGWRRSWVPPVVGVVVLALAAVVVGRLYPAFVQKFKVEPNQLAMESPYIQWNLEFTRRAYGLDRLGRRSFSYRPASSIAWEPLAERLRLLSLWDEDPLVTTYNQVEAKFGYYHFADVDQDRYGPVGGAQQVAIAVREFNARGLPETARTWQTLRLNPKYVRGVGAVISPTALSTAGGEPHWWLRNVDPVVRDAGAPDELELADPSIYLGETMGEEGGGQEYVILVPGRDSTLLGEPGVDYPAGIRLGSFPRLLSFAWRFRDKNLLFSGELTDDSRIVFRRSVVDRIRSIAPFLAWDPDAYPVVSRGRIVWIVDGYVESPTFPLSRPVALEGVGVDVARYLRNSVKATVDALTGEVAFYQIHADDPVLETYRRIFPGIVRPLAAMPEDLRSHLRYPVLYFRAQAEILKEYHIDRPEVFFAGQDLWQLPQFFGRSGTPPQTYRPTYAVMALPGEDRAEFLLSIPFIARERQNMTALLVARNDAPHYGELVLLELPRDQQISGPSQVAAMMEQDPVIAPQLTLWRQAGSDVHLGRLRVVPLDSTFLYVQPIFLSARESAIPELARVVVSDGSGVSMAAGLEEAIAGLGSNRPGTERPASRSAATPTGTGEELRRRALDLVDEAERRLRAGDWAGFGARWAELRALLRAGPPGRP